MPAEYPLADEIAPRITPAEGVCPSTGDAIAGIALASGAATLSYAATLAPNERMNAIILFLCDQLQLPDNFIYNRNGTPNPYIVELANAPAELALPAALVAFALWLRSVTATRQSMADLLEQ